MNQPKVSVIISTYNRPERLRKAIQSVIDQTYKDWECIVVHDDDSNEISIFEDKVKHIWIEHFGNDTKPKNEGIKVSTGDYIAFLDDDNTFRPDHLAILVKELEANTQVAMVYGDRYLTDETGSGLSQLGTTANWKPHLLLEKNYIDTSDVLIRRQALFDVGGFDERYGKYVDWNLWLRLEKYGHAFKRVPIILTNYYLHNDSKSVVQQKQTKPDWVPMDLEVELPYLGEIKEPKVAIFTLTYDRLEYTKKCFESLEETTGYPYDHYIVDNGSSDDTVEWIKANYDYKWLMPNEENKGISIASNQAVDEIMHHDYDIIVKVDNDAFFLSDGWLKTMVDIWKRHHKLALSCYVQGLRDNPGGAPRYGYKEINGELIGFAQHLGGICTFVDARAYKDFRWDEDSFLHGVQDREFTQYLDKAGYGMGYLENWYLEHVDGTQGQEDKYPEYFQRRKTEKSTKYAAK